MNPEKHPTENLDADILQCKADILRALQEVSQTGGVRKSNPLSQSPEFTVSPESTSHPRNMIQDNNYPVGARILSFDQLQKASEQKKDLSQGTSAPIPVKSQIEEALSQEIGEKNIQIQVIEKQLSEERQRSQELTADLTAIRLQAEHAGEQLKHLQAELEERKSNYESFLIQNKDMQDALSAQNLTIQTELDSKKNELHLTQNQIGEIQNQLTAREHDIQHQKEVLDSTISQLNEKQLLLEQAQTTIKTYQQQMQSQPDASTILEQKQRQIEQLKFEQLEQHELNLLEKTSLETKIASLEQLADQLKQENVSQSQELVEIRKAMSDLEQLLNQSRREKEAVNLEKTSLANTVAEFEAQCRRQQEDLISLRQQNDTLATQNQEAIRQLEVARSEFAQQSCLSEETLRQLKLRVAELEDQITETGDQADSKTAELKHLINEQKQLLEKTEYQRRDLENRLAGLQAENDRLCAAGSEMDQLREQIQISEQRFENISRQLERLKGDYQLLGEENNQLHSLVYLRDHELEKLQTQIQQLQSRLSSLEQDDYSRPAIEHPVSDIASEQPESLISPMEEISSAEPVEAANESESDIPSFNLAEQIMAEHRRSVASQRQSPGTRPHPAREDAISRVVGQFVKTPDTTEPENIQIVSSINNNPVSELPERPIAQDIPARYSDPSSSEILFADIVKRDILRFLDKKQKSLQRPPWSWNHN